MGALLNNKHRRVVCVVGVTVGAALASPLIAIASAQPDDVTTHDYGPYFGFTDTVTSNTSTGASDSLITMPNNKRRPLESRYLHKEKIPRPTLIHLINQTRILANILIQHLSIRMLPGVVHIVNPEKAGKKLGVFFLRAHYLSSPPSLLLSPLSLSLSLSPLFVVQAK